MPLVAAGLLALTACTELPHQTPPPGAAAPPLSDGGPPPGLVLSTEQLRDPVPRDEAPSRYGNPVSYSVFGKRYTTLKSAAGFRQRGLASWYGTKFHGQRTSSGETYDMYAMTAAHKTLPLPTYVEVRNLNNGRTAIVRVNDRGPFHSGRIIDLSYAAAFKLGVHERGTAPVEIRAVSATRRPTVSTRPALTTRVDVQLKDLADAGRVGMFLQVGAFADRANAERLDARLQTAGLPAATISPTRGDRGTLYRVRIGPLYRRAELNALLPQLADAGIRDSRLVTADRL